MLFTVSSYSYIRLIRDGQMTQKDCIAKAKEMGFDGIEFSDFVHDDNVSDLEHAAILREEAERCNMPIVNWAFGCDFLTGCGGDTAAEIERKKIDRRGRRSGRFTGASRLHRRVCPRYPRLEGL